jgi:hypothetical protein
MGSILASAIVDRAEIVLQDTTNVHWAASELLGWLNDGQREIALAKPDACVVTKSVLLTAGTRQAIGAGTTTDAVMLLKVVRNMGIDGSTPGPVVRIVPGEMLDANRPNWHLEGGVAAVTNVVFDPRAPKQFYVYPPSNGSGYVEVMYSAVPATVGSLATAITVDDIWANALMDYVLYRAYSKPYVADPARAMAYYTAFAQALGINNQNIAANNPNLEEAPFNPAIPGAAK